MNEEIKVKVSDMQVLIALCLGIMITVQIIIGVVLWGMAMKPSDAMVLIKHFYGIDSETNIMDVSKESKKRRKK